MNLLRYFRKIILGMVSRKSERYGQLNALTMVTQRCSMRRSYKMATSLSVSFPAEVTDACFPKELNSFLGRIRPSVVYLSHWLGNRG
jgi:hypothetical protein